MAPPEPLMAKVPDGPEAGIDDGVSRPVIGLARASVVRRPTPEEIDPQRFRRRRRRIDRLLGIGLPVVLMALWQVCSELGWFDSRFFPPPSRIWTAGVELVDSGRLQSDLWVSTRRVLLGFSIGTVTGVAAAVALQASRLVRAAVEPLTYALWTVPKLALLPMLLLIFGIGETPIVILIVINCFFLVFIPTLAAMTSIPLAYREVAESFRVSRWQMFRHVVFPCALPHIFVALRLTAGASILVLVAVEFVQSQSGLGYLIWNSWSLFLADRMYVGIVVVAVAGALFTMVVSAVGRRLTRWAPEG
jgi:NitT/TauT family transport system permease protein/sulfonate transport system permease protein